jgi:hypothetical protein
MAKSYPIHFSYDGRLIKTNHVAIRCPKRGNFSVSGMKYPSIQINEHPFEYILE